MHGRSPVLSWLYFYSQGLTLALLFVLSIFLRHKGSSPESKPVAAKNSGTGA